MFILLLRQLPLTLLLGQQMITDNLTGTTTTPITPCKNWIIQHSNNLVKKRAKSPIVNKTRGYDVQRRQNSIPCGDLWPSAIFFFLIFFFNCACNTNLPCFFSCLTSPIYQLDKMAGWQGICPINLTSKLLEPRCANQAGKQRRPQTRGTPTGRVLE